MHQIDSAALRSAASAWHEEFAPLPKPLVVVNVGGPTGTFCDACSLVFCIPTCTCSEIQIATFYMVHHTTPYSNLSFIWMSEFCRAFEILFGFVIHLSYGCEYEEGVCVVYMIQYQKFFTGCCRYGSDLAKQLTAHLLNVLVSCGSIKISFSMRTPEKVLQQLLICH